MINILKNCIEHTPEKGQLRILATIAFVELIIFISAYLTAVRASATSPIEAIRLSKDIKIKGKTVKASRLTRFLWGI